MKIKLASASSLAVAVKAADGYPSMNVVELLKPDVWSGFVEVANEIIEHVQQ